MDQIFDLRDCFISLEFVTFCRRRQSDAFSVLSDALKQFPDLREGFYLR
jgi:hypothetical protein